jgi:glycosyltransferase involved in cell wall biosynthesis
MISPMMPAMTGNGLAMRSGLFLQALARIADVDLLVVPVFGPVERESAAWATRITARVRMLDRGRPDTHYGLVARIKDPAIRLSAFENYGKPSISAWLSAATIADVAQVAGPENYDLVHVERGYCAPFGCAIGAIAKRAPILTMDLDEDDSRFYTSLGGLAGKTGRPYARRWNLIEARAFRRLLDEMVPAYDRVWVSSSVDRASLRSSPRPVIAGVVPNAVVTPGLVRSRSDRPTLLFVGSLGYEPNQDGIGWFLSKVWPRLSQGCNVRLQIVGPHAPLWLQRLARQRGVEMLGRVRDPARYYAMAALTIVPIRVGAGSRIKLVESALHGVAAVSTSAGAEGSGLRSGRHLWLADSPGAFIAAIKDALDRPEERRRRARAARAHVTAVFNREASVARLSVEFLELLCRSASAVSCDWDE